MATSESQWRLQLDGARCDGHGICAVVAPEFVGLDEWGYAVITNAVITGRRDLKLARRLVHACPARALVLVDMTESTRGVRGT